jgi:hypothetical protein
MNKLHEQKIVELIKGGGCFVSTRIGLYRANKRLTADELQLGDLPEKLVSMGSLKLLPDDICPEMKCIRSIENRVNALVNLRTFEFEGFGRYLKNESSSAFAEELEELRKEFDGVVDVFVENYLEYIQASVDFWGGYADEFGIQKKAFEEAIRESFIPAYKLREKFKFVVTYLQIPDPAREAWKNCEEEYTALSQEFVEMTMRQLRHEAVTAMNEMANSIATDKWNQKTLNKLPKMIERIKQMQIVEDVELTSRIEAFEKEFVTMEAKGYKAEEGEEALARLRTGLSSAVTELKELAEADLKESLEKKLSAGGGRKITMAK